MVRPRDSLSSMESSREASWPIITMPTPPARTCAGGWVGTLMLAPPTSGHFHWLVRNPSGGSSSSASAAFQAEPEVFSHAVSIWEAVVRLRGERSNLNPHKRRSYSHAIHDPDQGQ